MFYTTFERPKKNSSMLPISSKNIKKIEQDLWLAKIERSLIRAGKEARRIARFHGTPIHIMKDGKIIAIKP